MHNNAIPDYRPFDLVNESPFTGYLDYDRERLRNANADEKTEWLKVRTAKIIINPVRTLYEHHLIKNDDRDYKYKWDFYLPIALVMIIAIEALGSFRYPNKARDGETVFGDFMGSYFSNIWTTKIRDRTYATLLYSRYRHLMTHHFYARGFWEAQQKEYIVEQNEVLTINIHCFHFDFVGAVARYFGDLDNSPALRQLVQLRVDALLR